MFQENKFLKCIAMSYYEDTYTSHRILEVHPAKGFKLK